MKGGAHKESVALKAIEERIFVFFFNKKKEFETKHGGIKKE